MKAIIENVQYVMGAPNSEGDDATAYVTCSLFKCHINFKQADLTPDGSNWGDAEVLAEVQRKLDTQAPWNEAGLVAEFPVKPVFPATPEEPAPAPAPAPPEEPVP